MIIKTSFLFIILSILFLYKCISVLKVYQVVIYSLYSYFIHIFQLYFRLQIYRKGKRQIDIDRTKQIRRRNSSALTIFSSFSLPITSEINKDTKPTCHAVINAKFGITSDILTTLGDS